MGATTRRRVGSFQKLATIATIIVAIASVVSARQFQGRVKPTPAERQIGLRLYTGARLNDDNAHALEAGLSTEPDNSDARTQLLAYYHAQRAKPEEYARRIPHLMWIIEHLPQEPLCREEFTCFVRVEPEQCTKGANLWAANVAKYPADAQVLKNAAFYSQLCDHTTALEYYRKGSKLEPNDPYWPWQIGVCYERDCVKQSGEIDSESGAECLLAYMAASKLAGSSDPQYDLRGRLARAAFYAGEFRIATERATAVIDEFSKLLNNDASRHSDRSEMVEAIHRAELVLGHVALREGHLDKACEHLNLAADYLDAPTLKSFGPNMLLALELLREGRTESVVAYLEKCTTVWGQRELVRRWIADIRAGKEPAFAGNLIY